MRHFRPEGPELDIDFVVHGTEGIAGPWAARAEAGDEVAFIDQGCGWRQVPAEAYVLVADESGLPAVAGVLNHLPRDVRGHAIIELFDLADRQEIEAPTGMTVHWLQRDEGADPGAAALPELRALALPSDDVYAFAVGEQALATGARRHLVGERGLPKTAVTFSGYWRLGKAAPS